MNARMRIYLVVFTVLLAVVAVWCVRWMLEERDAARAAAADLVTCHGFQAKITRLRNRPALAEDRERRSAEISGPIERAAREAHIPAEQLVRISPEPARRIGETPYKEKPTRVFLKDVSLTNVVTMVHGLTCGETGLDLKSIRLTAPSRDATAGTWSAELAFTYLIYEPQRTRL